jgi:tRNA A-37 threonylcarbamoyl transferase component Bud32/tetratricopeptide (TPR) repeat protein
MLTAGTALGPYEIVSSLGAGGMGEVYRARDTRLHREVAIKVLQESVAGSRAWDRFQREARAASALSHPHICAVYDVGEVDGQPFLVMELVDGQTLSEFLSAGPLDVATAIRLGIQIVDALEAAHAKGVIHRDIKPGNIMIAGSRHVKVLDFGLAKHVNVSEVDEARALQTLTQTGLIMGTPHYMAPEILQGHAADVRSDLWAFGVVLYEMVSGRHPFEGTSAFEVASAIVREVAPPLTDGVPAGLRAVIERCLAKRPEERFRSAAEAREALEALQAPAVGGAVGDTPRTVTGAPGSRNPEANDAFALATQFVSVQNDVARGQKQLERALELDPHFAEARRLHGFNYLIYLLNGYSNDATLLYTAEDELREAEAEDPTLASLPSSFAAVYMAQGRKEMIPVAALERASTEGWAVRDALLWRAIISLRAGETDVAKELARRSLERDPLFGAPRMILGEALRMEGDVQGSIREQLRVLEQAPGNISAIRLLTLAYLDADAIDKARALLEEKRDAFGQNFVWRSAWSLLLACAGKRREAIEAMDGETLKFARFVFMATLEVAEFYAVLGDTSRAIEWLEASVRNGDDRVEWFGRDPRLAAIRDDARFRQILQSIEARRRRRATQLH